MKYLFFNVCLFLGLNFCITGCKNNRLDNTTNTISESFNISAVPDTKLYPIWDSTYRIGYINARGEVVIPCKYFAGSIFANNRAFVVVDTLADLCKISYGSPTGMWQMIDTKGNLIGEPFLFYDAPFFCGKLLLTSLSNNKEIMPYIINQPNSFLGNDKHTFSIDTNGRWHSQYYADISLFKISSMVFYDSYYNSYSIKNKNQKYCSPFISKYAIQKLNQKSILIDTAQNYIAELPDSLSFIESVQGNYLVCITGNYNFDSDIDYNERQKNINQSYRVVIDKKGQQYASFRLNQSDKAVNGKILYHGKDNQIAYYDISTRKHISKSGVRHKTRWSLSCDREYYYLHYLACNILKNSIIAYDENSDYSSLYSGDLNLIRSDMIVYNCIEGAELALVRIGDKVSYMNEYGQLVWSESHIDKSHIFIDRPYISYYYGSHIII